MTNGGRVDERGFADFYEGCRRRLVGELSVVLTSVAEAEDVVQEAFAVAYLQWRKVSSYDEPAAFVRRVALNLAWKRQRTSRRRGAAVERLGAARWPDDRSSEEYVDLAAALRDLPFDQRVALMLFHTADMSVAAIAHQLDVPEGTVKARLSRGRAALRARLAYDEETTS
ncbi:MAG: sigma-70 family polymerase [Frankiales bacterium]|nr:sigma-70 family polymerase [Frankiales bacterium]